MTRVAAIILCAIIVTLAAPMPAAAATYYVASSGSDANPGTTTAPWASLQKAADTIGPGDVVIVRAGTYAGFNTNNLPSGASASSPFTFRAEGPGVVLDNSSSDRAIIIIEGANHVIVDGFRIDASGKESGVRILDCTGVVIRNNTIGPSSRWGVFTGFTPGVQIIDNSIFGAAGEHGVYISNSRVSNDDAVIRGNSIYGNGHNGIQLNGDCYSGGDGIITGAVIEENFVYENGWKGLSLISMASSTIRNNVIVNNGLDTGAGGIHLADEPGCGKPSDDNVIVNNTVVEPRIAAVRITDASSNNVFFNNIAVGRTTDRGIVDEVGGNLIDSSSNIQIGAVESIFVNPAGRDFHLSTTSPALDAGRSSYSGAAAPGSDLEGANRPQGAGFDIGAYEGAGAPDEVPPSVSVSSPTAGATVSGIFRFQASATDNIGIAGVQFRIDGTDSGVEDRSSPYELTLDTATLANGTHTVAAVARDYGGNTVVSAAVSFTVDNNAPPPPGDVPQAHPRLFLNPQRLAEMRSMACVDGNGNTVANCTPSPFWLELLDHLDSGKAEAWNFALAYRISGDPQYLASALSLARDRVACGFQCVVASNSRFLNARIFFRDVALCYDWLYDELTPADREEFVNYMNLVSFLFWNDNSVSNSIHDAGNWALDDPASNFFYSFMLATAYGVVATWHENPGTFTYNGRTYNLEYDFDPDNPGARTIQGMRNLLFAKLDELAIPDYLEKPDRGRGGGWHEGNQYGLQSKKMIMEMYLILKDSGARDYLNTTEFPREALIYHLYSIQPGNELEFPAGDMGREPTMAISAYDRVLMLLCANAFEGTPESEYAQHWLKNPDIMPIMEGISLMTAFDMLLYRPGLPSRSYDELALSYRAEGLGWVNSRSSWERDAVSVTFNSSERVKGHQHPDQNSFSIFRGRSRSSNTSLDGWLVGDVQPYASGLVRNTKFHNTIALDYGSDLVGQRYGEGTGRISKYEAGEGFTYAVGDASDAYDEIDGDDYGSGTPETNMLEVFQREIVHILPGYVIVYDRVSPRQSYETARPVFLLHYPYVPPTRNGNLLTFVNGENKLFHRILAPASPEIAFVDDASEWADRMDAYRLQLTDPQIRQHYSFLNVFYATSTATATMPATALVTTLENNMIGAKITDGARDIVAMFSSDPFGASPAGTVTYEVSVDGNSTHHLHDMIPGGEYQVDVVTTLGRQLIIVGPGAGYRASSSGVLVFHVEYNRRQSQELYSSLE